MIPSAFVVLKSFPLTLNGKVDRKALPEPVIEDSLVMAAPRSPDEAALVEIFAKALGRQCVGIDDNFFALGGHSLLAARAVALVKEVLNRDVSLRMLFEAPTVATFAQMIGHAIPDAPPKPVDLVADVVLDPSIKPPTPLLPCCVPPEAILLTGATGLPRCVRPPRTADADRGNHLLSCPCRA